MPNRELQSGPPSNPDYEAFLLSNIPPVSPEAEVVGIERSNQLFGASVETFSQQIPELQDTGEAVKAAGAELIEAFGLKPELFDSPYRSLIFTSISSKFAHLKEAGEETPVGRRQKEYIADATFLLGQRFTDGFTDLRAKIDSENNPSTLSDKGKEAVYDKYTDPIHSAAIEKSIQEGLLDDLKNQMGVTDDNEQPFTVRVMSLIGTDNDVGGLNTPFQGLTEEETRLELSEQRKIVRASEEYEGRGKKWKAGLLERGKKFRDEAGFRSAGRAWVETLSGVNQLCISLPLAEKILYGESVTKDASSYDETDAERDLALLKHEYVHTQPGLIDPKLDIDFGISTEERRAEYFSGDRQGYADAKSFHSDLALLTGISVYEMFEGVSQKARDPNQVLTLLANNIGLDRIVELLTVVPGNYAKEQSNEISKNLHASVGGYDGLLQSIYDEKVKQGQLPGIQERLRERIKWMVEQNYDYWTPEQFNHYRKQYVSSDFLLEESTEELKKQRTEYYKNKLKTVNFAGK